MDYAMKKGISLSTLRRYIKANKIVYRIENGRYLLPDEGGELGLIAEPPIHFKANAAATQARINAIANAEPSVNQMSGPEAEQTIQKLKHELQKAREEIVELKTLIAFYEESASQHSLDV